MKPAWYENVGRDLRDTVLQVLRDYSEALALALLMAIILRLFVFGSYKVSNLSMEPTLKMGDFAVGYKLPYGMHIPFSGIKIGRATPRRGEVVVFSCPGQPNATCTRRVIGLAGDRIEMIKKRLVVNGEVAKYERAAGPELPPTQGLRLVALRERTRYSEQIIMISDRTENENFGPFVVAPDNVFVLADNRDFSEDSRFWGGISLQSIEAAVRWVWFSVGWSGESDDLDANVRWNRILTVVN